MMRGKSSKIIRPKIAKLERCEAQWAESHVGHKALEWRWDEWARGESSRTNNGKGKKAEDCGEPSSNIISLFPFFLFSFFSLTSLRHSGLCASTSERMKMRQNKRKKKKFSWKNFFLIFSCSYLRFFLSCVRPSIRILWGKERERESETLNL